MSSENTLPPDLYDTLGKKGRRDWEYTSWKYIYPCLELLLLRLQIHQPNLEILSLVGDVDGVAGIPSPADNLGRSPGWSGARSARRTGRKGGAFN